jgi:hypothetical protein
MPSSAAVRQRVGKAPRASERRRRPPRPPAGAACIRHV